MDYKEKYEKAIIHLKKFLDGDCVVDQEILADFPELAESEDERVRRWITALIHEGGEYSEDEHPMALKAIHWLEKQKERVPKNGETGTREQKPVEWKPQPESLEALMYAIEGKWDMIPPTSYLSRRLEDLYEGLVNTFHVDESYLGKLSKAASAGDIEELRELKSKIDASMYTNPVEWSEEDEEMRNDCIDSINFLIDKLNTSPDAVVDYKNEIAWLKSLRNRPKSSDTWRPSEEQMETLRSGIEWDDERATDIDLTLQSLYFDLMKL